MLNKKYELTEITKEFHGLTLHRIRALKDFANVKAGELGGWIESERNLSQDDNAWVYGIARVFDNAMVYNDAGVFGNAEVFDNARIFEYARVYENSSVFGEASVYGSAKVFHNAMVYDNSSIYNNVRIYNYAEVFGNAKVCDNSNIFGDAWVCGDAWVRGNANIGQKSDVLWLSFIGERSDTITIYKGKENQILVNFGCFYGTLNEFSELIKRNCSDSYYRKEYAAVIELARVRFK